MDAAVAAQALIAAGACPAGPASEDDVTAALLADARSPHVEASVDALSLDGGGAPAAARRLHLHQALRLRRGFRRHAPQLAAAARLLQSLVRAVAGAARGRDCLSGWVHGGRAALSL